MAQFALCWNCAKATSGCSWSDSLRPVKGWTAKFIKKNSSRPYDTWLVENCPQFEQDAIGGGMKWMKGAEHDINSKKCV